MQTSPRFIYLDTSSKQRSSIARCSRENLEIPATYFVTSMTCCCHGSGSSPTGWRQAPSDVCNSFSGKERNGTSSGPPLCPPNQFATGRCTGQKLFLNTLETEPNLYFSWLYKLQFFFTCIFYINKNQVCSSDSIKCPLSVRHRLNEYRKCRSRGPTPGERIRECRPVGTDTGQAVSGVSVRRDRRRLELARVLASATADSSSLFSPSCENRWTPAVVLRSRFRPLWFALRSVSDEFPFVLLPVERIATIARRARTRPARPNVFEFSFTSHCHRPPLLQAATIFQVGLSFVGLSDFSRVSLDFRECSFASALWPFDELIFRRVFFFAQIFCISLNTFETEKNVYFSY